MEHFSALPQTKINSSTKACPCHAVFHYFLLDDSKQDSATTTAHIKILIELLKKQKLMKSTLSTIWENTDGCAEQYICASSIYLMSFLSQSHSIIIDRGISAPGNGKELVDGPNSVDKRYMYQLMYNIQIPGSRTFYSQILMHYCIPKMMSVWPNNSKKICLRMIVNM